MCRRIIEEILRYKEQGLEIPEHLLPRKKEKKDDTAAKDKKKK